MRRWLVAVVLCGACSASVAGPQPDPAARDGDMVAVPAGWFVMGSEADRLNEAPAHPVWIDAFDVDRHEVTVAQYGRFVGATGWRLPGNWDSVPPRLGGELPVTHVSWRDATAYCAWLGKRLPTEAEWEKAARGTDGRRYPWGEAWDPGRAAADLAAGPLSVGSHPTGASPYGALDMAGNVHEWVADFYDPAYYAGSPSRNPLGPDNQRNHVLRGGSWASPPEWVTTTFRDSSHSDTGDARFGFRCASDVAG